MQPSPEVGRRIERGLGDGRKRFAPSSALPSPTGPRVPALSAPPGETAAPIPAADPAAASTMRMSMFPAVS